MTQAGLIVLYQWRIAEPHVPSFTQCWAKATEDLKAYGALGSLLARGEDGTHWAIARWESCEKRAEAEANYLSTDDWPPAQRLQTIMLEPLENRWI